MKCITLVLTIYVENTQSVERLLCFEDIHRLDIDIIYVNKFRDEIFKIYGMKK